jgi:tetratricopeptide (TPR) repeat protein
MTSPASYQSSKAKGMELLYSKKKYDAAILQFEKALSIYHDDNGKQAELHNLIGCALFRKKDYSAALEAFGIAVDKATNKRHENNHPTTAVSDLGWILYRMGKCFHELGRYDTASDYWERSAIIFQSNSSHLEASQNRSTYTTMARKLRSTLALSKSKRATRCSRRDNSVRVKADTNIKPTERLFDPKPQVKEDVIISSKTPRKEEKGVVDSKSVIACTILGTGSLSSGDHAALWL